MIPFSSPGSAPREAEYVAEALRSGRVGGDGPFSRRAEAHLADVLAGARALLTPSGTHALELAALLLDVGPDDEVVMPAFTFPSTANAFRLRRASVRFADIDPGTLSMGLSEVQAARTPRTTAVVSVPYGGVTHDTDRIGQWCAAEGLPLVEDAAHGLFASLRGRPLGTIGCLGALSFHETKNVSCGEGGALIVNDPGLLAMAEVLREKGTDRSRFLRGEVDKYTWQAVGSSHLLSDLLAAVLTAQLEAAGEWQRLRHEAWEVYRDALLPLVDELGIRLQEIGDGVRHPAHLFALLVPPGVDRSAVLRRLKGAGLAAVSHFEPLHLAPAHDGDERLPVTEDVVRRLVRLPLHAHLTADDAVRVAAETVAALRSATEQA